MLIIRTDETHSRQSIEDELKTCIHLQSKRKMLLTTSRSSATLPEASSVFRISIFPFFAARWSAVAPSCNKIESMNLK